MISLSKYLKMGVLVFKFATKMKWQRQFAKTLLQPLCNQLSESEMQRLYKYGLYVPLFIGEAFSALRGAELAENERVAITCLGCMTGLFDDLFDENQYSDTQIRQLLEYPEKNVSHSAQVNILVDLYHLFFKNTSHSQSAKLYISKVFDAQVASRKQLTASHLYKSELEAITFNKGGFTMQLYRRAFENTISDTEDLLYYQLGAIGQLENDIFDVYNDINAGIATLATKTTDINSVEDLYRHLHSQIWRSVEKTNFKLTEKEHFKQICSLVIARGYVALHQFKKLTKNTKGVFELTNYSRKQLICDMEKPLNRVKLLHYAANCIKK